MEIRDRIKPFTIVDLDCGSTLCLYSVCDYKQEIFDSRADDGFTGDGYDWASLAELFVSEEMPDIADEIQFDPDADMFNVCADEPIVLEAFAVKFKAALDDKEYIYELVKRIQKK